MKRLQNAAFVLGLAIVFLPTISLFWMMLEELLDGKIAISGSDTVIAAILCIDIAVKIKNVCEKEEKMKKKNVDAGSAVELAGAKYLRDRLLTIKARLVKRREETVTERKRKFEELLTDYKTVEEAHEDFGWGAITEEEYLAVKAYIEDGEAKVAEEDRDSVAIFWIDDFINRLSSTISTIEFAMLPADEQARRIDEAEKWQEGLKKAREEAGG